MTAPVKEVALSDADNLLCTPDHIGRSLKRASTVSFTGRNQLDRRLSVRTIPVVFWRIIQADVQPRDSRSRGAQPDRFSIEPLGHRCSDRLQQSMALLLGSMKGILSRATASLLHFVNSTVSSDSLAEFQAALLHHQATHVVADDGIRGAVLLAAATSRLRKSRSLSRWRQAQFPTPYSSKSLVPVGWRRRME